MTQHTTRDPDAPPRPSLLIADDEQVLRESLAELLSDHYQVETACDGQAAWARLQERPFDAVLTDLRMPEMDGMALLAHSRQAWPHTPVVVMTAFGTVENAVAAMKAGAADYVLKPVQFDDVLLRLQRVLLHGEAVRTREVMTEQAAAQNTFHSLVGSAPAMTRLFDLIRKLSGVKSSVLIIGESGTGKELLARAIHYNGVTRDRPFVAVNCGAIPESLIESELFGHRKGAFTGAIRDRVGYFEAANGGTLFLDEISTLPLSVQSSLLRVLEERVVTPVGDTRPRTLDVRIVAASNQDLAELCRAGKFREDLLYRLDVVRLTIPPLRQRRQDIPLLVQHFLDKYTTEMNKRVTGITSGGMRALLSHTWRGNVRELENVIERAVIFADGREISVEDLPFAAGTISDESGEDLKEALSQFERHHIVYSLRRHRYDKNETARHLGIGVSSLYRKLDELAIPKNLEELDASSQTSR
jgi:DNA-binding NtrC family response regulator